MIELKNTGKKLYRLRTGYGLSKKALERVSGVSSRTISRIEEMEDDYFHDGYSPKLETVVYLSKTFGLTPGEFLDSKVGKVLKASPGICI